MMRILRRVLTVVILMVASLIVAGLVVLQVFDWNRLRPYIADKSEELMGRRLEIQGALEVEPGWAFEVRVHDVRFANAAWGNTPHMFSAAEAQARIRVLPLVFGRLEIEDFGLNEAHLNLERNARGEANWVFGGHGEKSESPEAQEESDELPPLPVLHHALIERFALSYVDAQAARRVEGTLDRLDLASEEGASPLWLKGRGQLQGLGFTLDTALQMEERAITAHDLRAVLGYTQVQGQAGWHQASPPRLQADLVVDRLHWPDFRTLLTASEARGKATAPSAETQAAVLFTKEPLSLAWMESIDADLKVRVAKITTDDALGADAAPGGLDLLMRSLRQASMVLELKDQVLRVAPLTVTLAQGDLSTHMALDARQADAKLNMELAIDDVRLERVIADVDPAEQVEGGVATAAAELTDQISGALGGKVQVATHGSSAHAWAQHADGRLDLAMSGGTFSYVIDKLAGLDLGRGVSGWLRGDEPIAIDCMIVSLALKSGVARSDVILLASEDTNIWGSLRADLGQESLDLRLEARPKSSTVGSVRTPIRIHGDLSSPKVRLEAGPLAARSAAAVALGALATPIASVLATISSGPGSEKVCAGYWDEINSVKRDAERDTAH